MRRDGIAAHVLDAVASLWRNMMMNFDAAPPCSGNSLAPFRRLLAVFCTGLLGDFNVEFGSAGGYLLI